MILEINFNEKKYTADLSMPYDISLPLKSGSENPNCYWADPVNVETISSGSFIGSVKAGGSVNYQKVTLTPHGNGTHTESYGHLSADDFTVNNSLRKYHFIAELISVTPEKTDTGDFIITQKSLQKTINHSNVEAIVIRTLPNTDLKKTAQYSGTNPPYLDQSATAFLAERNITQLLVDLPSVDREMDNGKLLAHKAFWRYPEAIRKNCTITELIYVDEVIPDGRYLLNLQITSLELDASPSKPVLYKLTEVS